MKLETMSAPCALVLALAALAGVTPAAHAQCQYSTVVIDGPPCPFGGLAVLIPQGLNNHGHVVGWWNHCGDAGTEAFFWSPETGLVTLPRPDTVFRAIAFDINDHGSIVGRHEFFSSTGLGWRGFVYSMETGEYSYMPPHPDAALPTLTEGIAINNKGVVAGRRSIGKTSEQPYNAAIWNTNTGEVIDFGVMNGPNSQAVDINESGRIAGWTGTIFDQTGFIAEADNRTVLIDSLFGAIASNTTAVNDFGLASGSIHLIKSSLWNAFAWTKNSFVLIEPLEGFTGCGAIDNNFGRQILTNNTPGHAAGLWQHGEHMRVTDLFAPGSGGAISASIALSDAGHILGRHIDTKAILLTPVGQPIGDINIDCRTDVLDLLLLLNQWGSCENQNYCLADLTEDGTVNVFDLLALLDNWTHNPQ